MIEDIIKNTKGFCSDSLWQLFAGGPCWDGNLCHKQGRDWLVKNGYADRAEGYNFLTADGVKLAVDLGMSSTGAAPFRGGV